MKPNPPKPSWQPTDAHPPIQSPLSIVDISPFIDPLEAPVLGASASDGGVLCDTCSLCWKLEVLGQFKNRRPDGSEFLLTERFCVFKDSRVSLAERPVLECSR